MHLPGLVGIDRKCVRYADGVSSLQSFEHLGRAGAPWLRGGVLGDTIRFVEL